MIIQISLQNLLVVLIYAIVIVAGILVIPILWNIKKMVSTLRPLIEDNKDAINTTIKRLPIITENIEIICTDIKETTGKIKVSVPVILEEVQSVTNATRESMEMASAVVENVGSGINDTIDGVKNAPNIMNYINIITDVIQIVVHAFKGKK